MPQIWELIRDAKAMMKEQKWDSAIALFKSGLDCQVEASFWGECHYELHKCYRRIGKWHEALQHLQKADETRHPKMCSFEVRCRAAQLHIQLNKTSVALCLLNAALSSLVEPVEDWKGRCLTLRASVWKLLGLSDLEMKDLMNAVVMLTTPCVAQDVVERLQSLVGAVVNKESESKTAAAQPTKQPGAAVSSAAAAVVAAVSESLSPDVRKLGKQRTATAAVSKTSSFD